jgi:ABC-type uncharacterized transport system substrate-binding protein
MRRLGGILICAVVLLAAASWQARAHPHSWIDIEVELHFTPDGRLAALRQSWIFDEAYTAYTTAQSRSGRAVRPDPKRLLAQVQEMLKNLKEYGYFTRVEQNGSRLALADARDPGAEIRDARLAISFTLPLAAAADPRAATLTYSVFDPTYFIEMLHVDAKAIRLVGAPADCAVRLRQPMPDPNVAARAAALDATQSGGDGLGQEFAERVSVRCGAPP